MPAIDLSILNQRQTPAFYADVFANRPAAGFVGRIFVSTNTFAFYRDNGTGWDLIGGPGTGTITGSGSFGSIALWNGTDTITYDVGLTWDGTANSLTASKFIVTGGTSSQFLKADGSVDSSSYVPYTGATTSLNMGANNISAQNYFINGNNVNSGGFLGIKQFNGSSSGQLGYTSISALTQNSLYFQFSQTNGTNKTFELSTGLLGTTIRQYQLPDADGTIALTSNIPSVSGAASQVAFFSGTNAITGENNLWWDSVNNHLGINTNTPGTALDVHNNTNTILQLNQTVATNDTRIAFQNSGTALWRIGNLYNGGANDFEIFDVVGAVQSMTVKKTTGQVLIGTTSVGSGKLVVASTSGDNGIQIVGATAPSLRIDSAASGPTKRIGLGISTATNNFIQGSADRDMCIFNGSTTASPILFGIYDAAAVNVQEAARISPARNLLLGTTTDAGQKLQVNGTAIITGAANFNSTGRFGNVLFSDSRLGVGINGVDQTYASIFVGGALTSGTNQYAILTDPQLAGTGDNYAMFANARIKANTAVGNTFGIYIASAEKLTGATITNNYALYIANQTSGSSTNYSIYSSGGTNYFGGSVGIGIASPTQPLQVQAVSNASTISLLGRASDNASRVDFFTNGATSRLFTIALGNSAEFYADANIPITFSNNGSEKMRLAASTGNLLVGLTADFGYLLSVNGTAYIQGATLFGGTIQTGAPSGGTSQTWKLGNYTGGVAVQAGKVRVEINGVPYDLLTA